jgi:hypothetical protein
MQIAHGEPVSASGRLPQISEQIIVHIHNPPNLLSIGALPGRPWQLTHLEAGQFVLLGKHDCNF